MGIALAGDIPLDIRPLRTYTSIHDTSVTDIWTPMKTEQSLAPLTPAVFYILLSLAGGDKHGYEIMKQVKHDSQGTVSMGTGTLYGSIKRMLASAQIEEAGERPAPEIDDERRRYYRLTALGRRALLAELQRYHEAVSLAHQRQLFPGSSAGASPGAATGGSL